MRGVVGMSGGVDSSVAAYLAQKTGAKCIGATARMCGPDVLGEAYSQQNIADAAAVAARLGVTEMPLLKQSAARGLQPEFRECGEVPAIQRIKLPEPPEKKLEWGVYFPVKLREALRKMLLSRPVVNRKKCISCGLCAKKCPPQTLKMQGKFPKFDYAGCIRCYCCQEFCPKGAITVESSFWMKVLSFLEKVIRKLNIRRRQS